MSCIIIETGKRDVAYVIQRFQVIRLDQLARHRVENVIHIERAKNRKLPVKSVVSFSIIFSCMSYSSGNLESVVIDSENISALPFRLAVGPSRQWRLVFASIDF